MIPSKLIKDAEKLHRDFLKPTRMNFSIYNDANMSYEEWLKKKRFEFGDRYSHMFVLKLKD